MDMDMDIDVDVNVDVDIDIDLGILDRAQYQPQLYTPQPQIRTKLGLIWDSGLVLEQYRAFWSMSHKALGCPSICSSWSGPWTPCMVSMRSSTRFRKVWLVGVWVGYTVTSFWARWGPVRCLVEPWMVVGQWWPCGCLLGILQHVTN